MPRNRRELAQGHTARWQRVLSLPGTLLHPVTPVAPSSSLTWAILATPTAGQAQTCISIMGKRVVSIKFRALWTRHLSTKRRFHQLLGKWAQVVYKATSLCLFAVIHETHFLH